MIPTEHSLPTSFCIAAAGFDSTFDPLSLLPLLPLLLLVVLIAWSVKMANAWERVIVLRLGKTQRVEGPGLFLLVPLVDQVVAVIDQRLQTTAFNAEQALTRDTVPVNVDAIVFWQIHDAERAALKVADYRKAINQVAQTSLRELIGTAPLSALLTNRRAADDLLREQLTHKTALWGVTVTAVEIRDVAIPEALQDAMSRQAQAERERQARVILGAAEAEVAAKFVEAANLYAAHPAALQLRAMNIIYEATKERGTTILIPSSMVDSLNPAAALALASQAAPAREASRAIDDSSAVAPARTA